jgi:hypothetical protein
MLDKVSREVNEEAITMASNPTRDLQEEFLAATRKSQETVVRAIKTWVETVKTVTPKLPDVYVPFADRLPKLPSVTVPFSDKLPKPEEVVASSYDFAEHLLALQRRFAEDLLNAMVPLIPGDGKNTGPKTPAARTEPKAVPVAIASPAAAQKAEPAPPKTEPKAPATGPAAEVQFRAPAVAAEPKAPAAKSEPKPAAVKPAAVKPAAVKPAAVKPATAKPAAAKPAAAKPAARSPRSAAAKTAPKPAARRAPKSNGASSSGTDSADAS